MPAVLLGFVIITSIAFFVPTLVTNGTDEVKTNRGIKAASVSAVVYLIIVAIMANG